MKLKLFIYIFVSLNFFFVTNVYASHQCDNGICQPQGHHLESCSSCSLDCGQCTTTTPAPTPNPTPGPATNPPTAQSTPLPQTAAPDPSTPVSTPNNPPFATTIPQPETNPDNGQTTESTNFTEQTTDNNTSVVTPSPTPVPTKPALIFLNKVSSTEDLSSLETISGYITPTTNLAIQRVEVSINNGTNWFRATLNGLQFSFIPEKLDDGNYQIVARVIDSAGNIGVSQNQEIVLDSIPPIIGGGILSLGPNEIKSNNGIYSTVKDSKLTLTLSIKGGPTKVLAKVGNKNFDLKQIEQSNLWQGEISSNSIETKDIFIEALDGAENTTIRSFGKLAVSDSGKIINQEDDTLGNVIITLFKYDEYSRDWTEWDGKTFGQENPLITLDDGEYNFLVQKGKYYVEFKKDGYQKTQSEIININNTSLINSVVTLNKVKSFPLSLFYDSVEIKTTEDIYNNQEISSKTLQQQDLSTDLLDKNGETIKLGNLLEGPTHVFFYASWISTSSEQLKLLSNFNIVDKNYKSIGISVQDSQSLNTTLLKRGNYNLESYTDTFGYTATVFNLSTLPQHVFINSEKIIKKTINGLLTPEQIIENLEMIN